jgi:hypothetical protein
MTSQRARLSNRRRTAGASVPGAFSNTIRTSLIVISSISFSMLRVGSIYPTRTAAMFLPIFLSTFP